MGCPREEDADRGVELMSETGLVWWVWLNFENLEWGCLTVSVERGRWRLRCNDAALSLSVGRIQD